VTDRSTYRLIEASDDSAITRNWWNQERVYDDLLIVFGKSYIQHLLDIRKTNDCDPNNLLVYLIDLVVEDEGP
jgi:hypothetical protein